MLLKTKSITTDINCLELVKIKFRKGRVQSTEDKGTCIELLHLHVLKPKIDVQNIRTYRHCYVRTKNG